MANPCNRKRSTYSGKTRKVRYLNEFDKLRVLPYIRKIM